MNYNERKAIEFVSCNLCNSNSTKPLMKINGFHIVKCRNCKLAYVNPRLKPVSLHKIYNKNYYKNPAFNGAKSSFCGYMEYLQEKDFIVATFKKRLDQIENYLKGGKLLDVGCAYGFFLELAKKNGWQVQGTEISEAAYMYAKNKLKLPVLNKALEEAEFKNESYDVVTLFDVIEHLPSPNAAIKEIRRILKPNGLLVITTPDIGSLSAKLLGRNWEEIKRVREHIYFFSRSTLKSMLELNNFKVLRTESAGRYFSVESAIKRAKIYNKKIFGFIEKLSDILNLNNKMIYIDPHYKITVYARKI